jgi:hypothetical protein
VSKRAKLEQCQKKINVYLKSIFLIGYLGKFKANRFRYKKGKAQNDFFFVLDPIHVVKV